MIGNNKMYLNEATIIAAVQMYLDGLMVNGAQKVTSVSEDPHNSNGKSFTVALTDRPKE